jgi:hypothetical protein
MKPLILLLTMIIGAASWFSETGQAQDSYDPGIAEMISHVADSTMRQSIASLQGFVTRYTFEPTRDSVVRWVRERFLTAGLTDVVLDTLYSGFDLVNVVATVHGTSDSAGEIVVGAHYDSYSPIFSAAPGADDNASGASAVIEMARVLLTFGYTPVSTIRFIAFAAEEQGLWGSSAYAQKARNAGRNIRAMLNFDMIGYRSVAVGDTNVYLVWYLGAAAESLAALSTAVIRRYTSLNPVPYTASRERSDSYSFAVMGYPPVFWLGYDPYPFYHTPYDLLEYLDVAYAAEIARSALALVLTLDRATVHVPAVGETVPAGPCLYQNYPNPFNPITTINYQLPIQSHLTLKVYNLLGQEVATLANEEKSPGTYTLQWDASGVPSGVYFYRVQAGKFSAVQKMLLVR